MAIEGNKDEADRCFKFAKKYFEEGDREKAYKFALKSQRLFPSSSCKGKRFSYDKKNNFQNNVL